MTNGHRAGPPSRRGPSRKILFGCGALVCAIAAGASLAVVASSGGPGHRTGQAPSAGVAAAGPTATSAPGTASEAGTGSAGTGSAGTANAAGTVSVNKSGIAKSAMRWPASLTSQMKSWAAGPGGAAMTAVSAELGNAAQSAALKLYSQTKAECARLGSGVTAAQRAPRIADVAIQRQYASALVMLATAAAGCQRAISVREVGDEGQAIHVNKALLNRSLAELGAASKRLYTATAEIRPLRH